MCFGICGEYSERLTTHYISPAGIGADLQGREISVIFVSSASNLAGRIPGVQETISHNFIPIKWVGGKFLLEMCFPLERMGTMSRVT